MSDFRIVTDVQFLKRQWLKLIDHFGEAAIRDYVNRGWSLSFLRKYLEDRLNAPATSPDRLQGL